MCLRQQAARAAFTANIELFANLDNEGKVALLKEMLNQLSYRGIFLDDTLSFPSSAAELPFTRRLLNYHSLVALNKMLSDESLNRALKVKQRFRSVGNRCSWGNE